MLRPQLCNRDCARVNEGGQWMKRDLTPRMAFGPELSRVR